MSDRNSTIIYLCIQLITKVLEWMLNAIKDCEVALIIGSDKMFQSVSCAGQQCPGGGWCGGVIMRSGGESWESYDGLPSPLSSLLSVSAGPARPGQTVPSTYPASRSGGGGGIKISDLADTCLVSLSISLDLLELPRVLPQLESEYHHLQF